MRYSSRLILSFVAVTLSTAQSQSAPPAKPGPLKITEPRNAAAGFAASNPFTPTIQPPAPTREVPLRFVRHNFSAVCFNTIGCRVGYNGRYQIDDAPDKVSRPPPNDMRDAWGGIEGTIRNFPPPVEVTWKSLDGVSHEAKVDLAAIFKEGLARLIQERGIQDRTGAIYARGHDGLITHVEYTKPPLVAPGQVAQAELLFDPVGTGYPIKHEDRRPPPSVLSGFQISAADERRSAFKSDHIIDPGMTPDGRFLGVSVAGAHSDIGGSYLRDGIGIRSENLGINYLNSFSDVPFVATQAVPDDPRMTVVHRSERAFPFEFMGTVDRSATKGYNESLVPRGEAARFADPLNAQPRDESFDRLFEHHSVRTGPQVVKPADDPQPITRHSSPHDMFEALCTAAVNKDPDAMRGVERSYQQSVDGQAWWAQGHEMNQQLQLQAQQAAFEAQRQAQAYQMMQGQGCAR